MLSLKQIVHFYSNHRSVPKEGEKPPVRVGKQWNTRLVVAHFFHDQIEDTVNGLGHLAPKQRIAKWASTLTEVIKTLDDEELAKYAVILEKWKTEGPPEKVKRK